MGRSTNISTWYDKVVFSRGPNTETFHRLLSTYPSQFFKLPVYQAGSITPRVFSSSTLDSQLRFKQQQAIEYARRYEEEHGDPLQNMSTALQALVGNYDEEWEALIYNPPE